MTTVKRTTRETDIEITLGLYNFGKGKINTGIGFFDHMLTAFSVHSKFGLSVEAKGDLEVDCHHTIEDVGIVLGQAFAKELGNRSGIARFGNAFVPMDEALAHVVLDISARPYLVYECPEAAPMIGEYDCQMTEEFLRAFAVNAGITLHARVLYGKNAHHMTEAIYKALAKALKEAVAKTGEGVLSSKGTL
jgi:imidazoleglycerol-phosphate dehydratase